MWSTMSAIEHTPSTDGATLEELPAFELTYLYDDDDNPTEVTVFLAGTDDGLATQWLTIDREHAVPLESVQ